MVGDGFFRKKKPHKSYKMKVVGDKHGGPKDMFYLSPLKVNIILFL